MIINFSIAFGLLLLAVAGVVVRKTYHELPIKELKRRARDQDKQAVRLYRAAAYGSSLNVLLEIFIGLCAALSVVVLSRNAPFGYAIAAVVLILGLIYAWLPAGRSNRYSRRLSLTITPLLAGTLNYLHPVLNWLTNLLRKRKSPKQHTGLYEREDLLYLLNKQEAQDDSRLTLEELDSIRRSLAFNEQQVGQIMTPLSKLKTVGQDETLGPILIDELHKSGQPYVLVADENKDVVGSLLITSLGIKSSGQVRDFMDKPLAFVHEDDALSGVIQAFLSTNHQLYVVVNDDGEQAGVISIATIIEQLTGQTLSSDDFDNYYEAASVITHHQQTKEPEVSPVSETSVPEESIQGHENLNESAKTSPENDDFESVEVD